jgi:hypothetical protein
MPQKLETVLKHVEKIGNNVNRQLIKDYHRYLVSRDTSTNYQKDNIKLMHMFTKFIGESKTLHDIKDQETIITFLDTRRKNKEEDPEQKWTTQPPGVENFVTTSLEENLNAVYEKMINKDPSLSIRAVVFENNKAIATVTYGNILSTIQK